MLKRLEVNETKSQSFDKLKKVDKDAHVVASNFASVFCNVAPDIQPPQYRYPVWLHLCWILVSRKPVLLCRIKSKSVKTYQY